VSVVISEAIRAKLSGAHDVTPKEVSQCFADRTGLLLVDTREVHRSDPPTLWFIAPTNASRLLKVCFVHRNGRNFVRTAYPPNEAELHIYQTKGNPSDF